MDVLANIGYGVLRLFLQPLFYLFLIFALGVHGWRIKQEREDFHVRVHSMSQGFREMLGPGLMGGAFASIVTLGVGLVLPTGMLMLVTCFYILAMLTFSLRLVNPAFVIGAAVLVAYFLPPVHSGFAWIDTWSADIRQTAPATAALLLGILLVVEGALIRVRGGRQTTPRYRLGARGKRIGVYEARKFWLLPLCLLVPDGAGAIGAMHAWPLTVDVGGGFSLLLVPFGFGFYHRFKEALPAHAIKKAAVEQVTLGLLVLLITGIGVYTGVALFAPIAAAAAMIARAVLIGLDVARDRQRPAGEVLPAADGLVVLAVLGGTPAEKMGIKAGDKLCKANGLPVYTEADFYSALQAHAAYCKLEVVDAFGEVRHTQTAVYEGDHHHLGLLFVALDKAEEFSANGRFLS